MEGARIDASTKIKKEILLETDNSRLVYYSNWIDEAKSRELFVKLREKTPWSQDRIRLFGKEHLIPRMHSWVADSDCPYTYSNIHLKIHPWFKELTRLKERLKYEFGHSFSGCLLNLYRNGKDSNGWHSDDEKEIKEGSSVASISLGEIRRFDVRNRETKEKVCQKWLESGSLLIMEGKFQKEFQHQVPKSLKKAQSRLNLTFREVLRKPQ